MAGALPYPSFTTTAAQFGIGTTIQMGVPAFGGKVPTPTSDAERAAAYRARRKAELEAKVRVRYRRPADKRTRPQRWCAAVAELVDLQADYAAWLDRLPESLRDTATAEALANVIRDPTSVSAIAYDVPV